MAFMNPEMCAENYMQGMCWNPVGATSSWDVEKISRVGRISGAESDFFWDMLCVYQIVLHYDETSRIDIFGSQNRTAR